MNMCKALEELEDIQFVDPIYEIIKQNPTITIEEIYQPINK